MMNRWVCGHQGCRSVAVGVGGAIGLLAIGWHFEPGRHVENMEPVTLCPLHRPASAFCIERAGEDAGRAYCAICTGIAQAERHQVRMGAAPWL